MSHRILSLGSRPVFCPTSNHARKFFPFQGSRFCSMFGSVLAIWLEGICRTMKGFPSTISDSASRPWLWHDGKMGDSRGRLVIKTGLSRWYHPSSISGPSGWWVSMEGAHGGTFHVAPPVAWQLFGRLSAPLRCGGRDSLCGQRLTFLFCFAGSRIMENGKLFKELLQTPNFRITVVPDADTVELCGALKVTACLLPAPPNSLIWLSDLLFPDSDGHRSNST